MNRYINKYFLLLICGIICLAIWCNIEHYHNEKKEINTWAKEHKYYITHMEMHWTVFGSPFNYVTKGEYIFQVDLTDENQISQRWWVRTSYWSDNDYLKDK